MYFFVETTWFYFFLCNVLHKDSIILLYRECHNEVIFNDLQTNQADESPFNVPEKNEQELKFHLQQMLASNHVTFIIDIKKVTFV
jgi:hypothetical protein